MMNKRLHTKRSILGSLTGACLILASTEPLLAQPMDPGPDTSTWVCEFCPPAERFLASIRLGSGWVSDPSYRFSRYSGLQQGGYALVDGSALWTSATDYWRLTAKDAGLRSRALDLDGGAAGRYRLRLRYSQQPHFIADSPLTIYPDAGSSVLPLPDGWVTGFSTQAMTRLNQSLRPLRLRQDRERFELGLRLTPAGRWRYKLDYQHESRDGVRAGAGGFLFTSSLLPVPVDQSTDQVKASAVYQADDWFAELSYYGSFFDNDNSSLLWENPFFALVPGATRGQIALAPDNDFHRVAVSGSMSLGARSQLTGRLGFGRMSQDEAFLPYTVNDRLPVNIDLPQAALPLSSLNGEIDVLDFSAALTARPGSRTRLAVKLDYYERDNQTSVAAWQPVTMDLFVNPPILNRPYSYERSSLRVEASHRPARALRLAGGVELEQYERSRVEAADTDEYSAWARLRLDLGQSLDASLKLSYSDRDGDEISPQALIAETENPLLRKFHYADRKRDEVRLTVSATPHEYIQLAVSGGYKKDDYSQSLLGLTDSELRDVSADLSIMPRSGLILHAFYTRENIESRVAGAQPDLVSGWVGDTVDRIHSLGAGLALNDLYDRDIDLSLDYVSSRARGAYRISTGTSGAPFPELRNRVKGLRMHISCPIRSGSRLMVDLYHERFESSDWALDGVAPDEVFNLLTLGETSPEYSINTIAISIRTQFQ